MSANYTPSPHTDPHLYGEALPEPAQVHLLQNRIAVLKLQTAVLLDAAKPRSAKVVSALDTISNENERLRMIVYQQRSTIADLKAQIQELYKALRYR